MAVVDPIVTNIGTITVEQQDAIVRVALKLDDASFYMRSSLSTGVELLEEMPMPLPEKLQIGFSNDGSPDEYFDGFIERVVLIPSGGTSADVDFLVENGYKTPIGATAALIQEASSFAGEAEQTNVITASGSSSFPQQAILGSATVTVTGYVPADLLQDSSANPVFLFEITPSDGSLEAPTYVPMVLGLYTLGTLPYKSATSGTTSFYFSDADWTERMRQSVSAPAFSDRENTHYEGRCQSPSLDRTIPVTPEAGVRSVLSVGEISFNNSDGYFDTLIDQYAVDGRNVKILLLNSPSNVYAQAVQVFSGVGVDWVAQKDQMTLRIRERSYNLDVPLLTLFGGTGGSDGTSSNQGHPIPQAYGICRNITGELIDPGKLIYRFHDRTANDVLAVYDRGAPVTKGTSFATFSELLAASTAGGTFDYCLSSSGSFFRLGSSPSGSVTADVEGDAEGGYVSSTGSIIKRLMLRGTLIADINTQSLDDIDLEMPGDIGCYFNAQVDISSAIDQLCIGTFTFWGDIGDGLLGVYQFRDPSGETPLYSVDEFAVTGEIEPTNLPDDIGPTVWRRRVAYRLNWTPMSGTDIVPAPTITEDRRKQLQDPNMLASIGIADRQVKNLLAVDAPTLVSMFDNYDDAFAIANVLLDLYNPGRGLWMVPVGLFGYRVRLNDVIRLKWPRFGFQNGKNVRVVGISYNGTQVTLTVFG